MTDNFGLKIGLEGEKEFKSQLQEINQTFKVLGSEMKLVDSQFDKNDKSVESLTARNSVLEKSITSQKSKIEVLRNALKNASESFGENDKRTQNWQIQLNNAQAELNKLEGELKSNTSSLEDSSKGLTEAKKSAKGFGDEVSDASKKADDSSNRFEGLANVCKGVAATMAATMTAISAAAISAGKALIKMTTEGANFADSVLTESTVTSIATDKLQEYMYAAELVDVSTETLTKSMAKQIKSMKAVQDGTKLSCEAYEKLGVDVLNADGSLRNSDDVYWEVIDALGKIENETERDALAMQILGKSAQELNPLIESGASKMKELGVQAHEAGYVISDDMLQNYGKLDDQIQYLAVGCTAAKNALGTILLPILTDLATEGVSFLSEFTNAIKGARGDINKFAEAFGELLPKALNKIMKYVPTLLNMIKSVIVSFGKAIIDNLDILVDSATEIVMTILNAILESLPKVTDGAIKLVGSLVKGILDNLPQILNAAIQVVVTLAKGLISALPKLIPSIVQVVVELCNTIIDNLPLVLNVALELIKGLAQGILDAIPVLIEALPELILSIINFILEAIPQIIDAGIELLTSLVDALPEIIESIVEAIPQIIDGIINALMEALPSLIDAGIRLFVAIIQALPEIITTILTAIPQIVNSIINALVGNIDKIIACGVTLFMALIENLPTIIVEIVKAIPQIISAIIGAFGSGFEQMKEVGGNLIKGLWEGIKGLTSWIKDKVSGWASDLWGGIKDFFGIHSPSTKMAWIGDMMMEGLAGGIDKSSDDVINSAKTMTNDLNSVFDNLQTDFKGIPTNFNVTEEVEGIKNINQGGGLTLQLQIENFNNYTNEDITDLTNEILETAGNFAKRKGVIFG